MSDFPAAHSMDTNWFAVDADGNVGVFDSDENGAVPHFHYDFREVHRIEDIEDFLKSFPKDEKGIIHLEIESKTFFPEDSFTPVPKSLFNDDDDFCLLLVLVSEEVIPKLKSPDNLVVRFSGFPVVVYVDECARKIIDSMVDSGEILGGKEFLLEDNYKFHHLGIFYYLTDDDIPAPYERKNIPAKPLKIEKLPTELQKYLVTSRFENIRFTDTEKIQPIEYTKCFTWGGEDYWIDSQGNKRKGFEI